MGYTLLPCQTSYLNEHADFIMLTSITIRINQQVLYQIICRQKQKIVLSIGWSGQMKFKIFSYVLILNAYLIGYHPSSREIFCQVRQRLNISIHQDHIGSLVYNHTLHSYFFFSQSQTKHSPDLILFVIHLEELAYSPVLFEYLF